MSQTVGDFMSYSISFFHDAIAVSSVATTDHLSPFHTHADTMLYLSVICRCQGAGVILVVPSQRRNG